MIDRSRRPETCLSNWVLDRIVTAEGAHASERAHLRDCARCSERLRQLEREQSALTAQPIPAWLPQLPPLRRARRPRWLVVSGLASALAASALLGVRLWGAELDTTRSKGGPRLGFYVKRGDRVFEGSAGTRLRPGDELRFLYSSATPAWLAVFGVDAARNVSTFYPARGGMASIAAARRELLPEATELDASLGDEQLVGIFCERERDVAELRVRLARDPRGVLELGCRADEIPIVKLETVQP